MLRSAFWSNCRSTMISVAVFIDRNRWRTYKCWIIPMCTVSNLYLYFPPPWYRTLVCRFDVSWRPCTLGKVWDSLFNYEPMRSFFCHAATSVEGHSQNRSQIPSLICASQSTWKSTEPSTAWKPENILHRGQYLERMTPKQVKVCKHTRLWIKCRKLLHCYTENHNDVTINS